MMYVHTHDIFKMRVMHKNVFYVVTLNFVEFWIDFKIIDPVFNLLIVFKVVYNVLFNI